MKKRIFLELYSVGINNPKLRYRVLWCPRNGCGVINGASPQVEVTCYYCRTKYVFNKLCPKCHRCSSCGRIAKKFYIKEVGF